MTKYKVKAGRIRHKGPGDERPRFYLPGNVIELNDVDAELKRDLLQSIDDETPIEKFDEIKKLEMDIKDMKIQHQQELDRVVTQKNEKLKVKEDEIEKLKELLKHQEDDSELSEIKDENASLRKELTVTKGLLTKAQKKINELEK